jgi:hypothetical protein
VTSEAMTHKPDVATLVRELRATLDQIGDALVNGAFDDLIATESRLAGIVGGFSQVLEDGGRATAAPSELDAALIALRRCQRLGESFADVGTSWFAAGDPNGYTRSGRSQAGLPPRVRPTIETRA